jgi:hypothetical protein
MYHKTIDVLPGVNLHAEKVPRFVFFSFFPPDNLRKTNQRWRCFASSSVIIV